MGRAGIPNNAEKEAIRSTIKFRDFKGVFTQSERTAVPEDHFYDLVNIQPIGAANAHTVPAPFITAFAASGDTIYWGQYVNINNVDYILLFGTSGKVYAYNESGNTYATINTGNLLSGAASRCSQWKNNVALFIDANGYFSWNGSTFTKLSNASNGTPTGGQDIAVAFGRVWVANGRVLYYSSQDDYGVNLTSTVTAWANSTVYTNGVSKVVDLTSGNVYTCTQTGTSAATGTGPSGTGTGIVDGSCTWNYVGTSAWATSNGSSFINLTDPLLRSVVQRLYPANGYLYIFGATSMFIISNVYVPSGASPPLPVYTMLNIDPIVGSDQPGSIVCLSRDLQFANRYGVYDLSGVEADRMSADIDGTWQYVDFTKVISGGSCIINQILCSCWLINQLNDPVVGSRNALAVYFDQKWFFVVLQDPTGLYNTLYEQPLSFIVSALYNDKPTCFAVVGTGTNQGLVRLFDNPSVSPPSSFKSALWSGQDPIADKQAIRAGFEMDGVSSISSFTLNVDTPNSSTPLSNIAGVTGVAWVNAAGATVQWVNNTGMIVNWFASGYLLYDGTAPGGYGKYIGLSFNSPAGASSGWGSVFELDGMYIDFYERARW